jgi:hypothetical protein
MFELVLLIALHVPPNTIYDTQNNTNAQNIIAIHRMVGKLHSCLKNPKCPYLHQARLFNIFDGNPTPTSWGVFVASATRGAPKNLLNAIRKCQDLNKEHTGCLNGDIQQCDILQKGLY